MPTYRHILRGTAIFGGTQVVTLLASLVRGKFVAILLGAHGMGISSLLTSALSPVIQFFSLGMPTAAVSHIAAAEDDMRERARRIVAFRRSMTLLAIMAAIYILAISPLMTSVTFSSRHIDGHDALLWVMTLAPAAIFTMLATTENAILQSQHALHRLALCNITGPLAGILLGVPIYWIWGVAGIAPGIAILAFVTWAVARYHTARLGINANPSWRETWTAARGMAYLGVAMMVAGMMGQLAVYITNTYISNYGSTTDVGLYQAATSITTQCTSMVFVALATDYYPHLAEKIKSRMETMRLIAKEGEIAMLITAPLAAMLIILAPVVVRVLLTEEFLTVIPLIQTTALAFVLRAFYFPLDYLCLAKNDKLFFFLYEGIWTNVQNVGINIMAYHLYGLRGLTYGIIVNGIINVVAALAVARYRYNVSYTRRIMMLSIAITAATAMIVAALQWDTGTTIRYAIAITTATAMTLFSAVMIWRRRKI